MSRSFKSRARWAGRTHNPKTCAWCISNRTHRHVKQAVFAPDKGIDDDDGDFDVHEYEIWLATGLYSDELFAAWKQRGMDRWSPALLSEARKPLRPLGQ